MSSEITRPEMPAPVRELFEKWTKMSVTRFMNVTQPEGVLEQIDPLVLLEYEYYLSNLMSVMKKDTIKREALKKLQYVSSIRHILVYNQYVLEKNRIGSIHYVFFVDKKENHNKK